MAFGREVGGLAREFNVNSQSIHNWVNKAGRLSELPCGTEIIKAHRAVKAAVERSTLTGSNTKNCNGFGARIDSSGWSETSRQRLRVGLHTKARGHRWVYRLMYRPVLSRTLHWQRRSSGTTLFEHARFALGGLCELSLRDCGC